jgi:Holliday junction resolvasome RuvABC DNA-binding subunit
MIAHLQGKLVEKHQHMLIVAVWVSREHLLTYLFCWRFYKLFTHLQIKKMHILYLDLLKSQKRFFKLLLSVSGIGLT